MELEPGDADRLRRAHYRLRKASQDLEAYTAPQRMRGRWDPAPVPDEALHAARDDFHAAYTALCALQAALFGWDPPAPPAAAGPE